MDNLPASDSDWFDREVNIDAFSDKRLGERLRILLVQLANRIGNLFPWRAKIGLILRLPIVFYQIIGR